MSDPQPIARQYVGVRIGNRGLQWVDKLAQHHTADYNRSRVIRAALAIAARHERDVIKILEESE